MAYIAGAKIELSDTVAVQIVCVYLKEHHIPSSELR